MVLVKRDPFARTELHRETVKLFKSEETCRWCGGFKPSRTGGRYLYRFRSESDGGRVMHVAGLYCSSSCFSDYNER